jgi:iron(III) transport system ATP-binding protein
MQVCIKTHDVELLPDASPDTSNTLPGVVRKQAYLGSHRDYVVDVGQEILITAPAPLDIPAGAQVTVRFPRERCRGLRH